MSNTAESKPVAIVTGSSRGVGAATAEKLAQQGWNMVLNCSRTLPQAQQVAEKVRELGSRAEIVQGDVGEDSTCRQLVEAAVDHFGRLDGVVNNAATTKFCDLADMDGLDADDFQNIYRVNVIGPFQLVRAALSQLRLSALPAGGAVVNIASTAGLGGIGSSVAYAASKGALITMTKSLARALGPVRVNAVCPGFIQGDWLRGGLGDELYEQVKGRVSKGSPLGITCTAEQIAGGVFYLLAQADAVTGETLIMDGGAHLPPMALR